MRFLSTFNFIAMEKRLDYSAHFVVIIQFVLLQAGSESLMGKFVRNETMWIPPPLTRDMWNRPAQSCWEGWWKTLLFWKRGRRMRTWKLSRWHDKTNKMTVRPAKTQISLGIRPDWSESSLGAQWVAKDPSFLHTDLKTLIRPGGCPGWSESSLGAQPHCWFCYVVAQVGSRWVVK